MNISPFDFTCVDFTNAAAIVIMGVRQSGKTTLIKDIITQHLKIRTQTIFSTEYEQLKTIDIEIYDKYDKNIIRKIMQNQNVKVLEDRSDSSSHLIVMDDTLYGSHDLSSNVLLDLFMNKRFLQLGVILTMQDPTGLKPTLRSAVDFLFILKETNMSTLRRMYDKYCGIFSTFDEFVNVFESITKEPYTCMVISYCSLSMKIEDNIFRYKVQNNSINYHVIHNT